MGQSESHVPQDSDRSSSEPSGPTRHTLQKGLCDYCTKLPAELFIPRLRDFATHPGVVKNVTPVHHYAHPSWAALRESASSCDLCALILSESLQQPKVQVLNYAMQNGKDSPAVRFQVLGEEGYIGVFCCAERVYVNLRLALDDESQRDMEDGLNKLVHGRFVEENPHSHRSVEIINSWIATCQENHKRCKAWGLNVAERKMPTRVLDLGESGTEGFIRLHQPNRNDVSAYAALSYCWGGPQTCTTTNANLSQRLRSIPASELPQTITDAVTVARKLGIRYLWVDALCIIQDNTDDWRTEASLMHKVYSGAHITISADSSASASQGFLHSRSERHRTAVPLPWTTGNGKTVDLYVCPYFKEFPIEMMSSPLGQRGWTFQERALSRRILHFGSELTYWECKEACVGEDKARPVYSAQDHFRHFYELLSPFPPEADPTWPNSRWPAALRIHCNWAAAISLYSRRTLKYGLDKSPALEGLARAFDEKGTLGKYVGGLWWDEFHRHLLWHCAQTEGVTKRSSVYRAPSWSWLSIDGPVSNYALELAFEDDVHGFRSIGELGHDGTRDQPCLQLEAICVTPAGPSPFGLIKSGQLTCTGYIKAVFRGESDEILDNMGGKGVGRHTLQAKDGTYIGWGYWDEEVEEEMATGHSSDGQDKDKRKLMMLTPLMRFARTVNGPKTEYDCLLLRQVEGQEWVFVRCGKARTTLAFLHGCESTRFFIV